MKTDSNCDSENADDDDSVISSTERLAVCGPEQMELKESYWKRRGIQDYQLAMLATRHEYAYQASRMWLDCWPHRVYVFAVKLITVAGHPVLLHISRDNQQSQPYNILKLRLCHRVCSTKLYWQDSPELYIISNLKQPLKELLTFVTLVF